MRHRLLAAVVLCTLVAALLVLMSVASCPLGEIEEHFELGRQWRNTGAFPAVLRPPGYPAFVALTLLARDGIQSLPLIGSRWPFKGVLSDDKVAVLAAQGLLLVVTSGTLFWFSSRDKGCSRRFAWPRSSAAIRTRSSSLERSATTGCTSC